MRLLRRRHRRSAGGAAARGVPPRDFTHLPASPDLALTVETKPDGDVPDPEAGRNTDRDFFLRYAGLG